VEMQCRLLVHLDLRDGPSSKSLQVAVGRLPQTTLS
jgi:hypothetical protein